GEQLVVVRKIGYSQISIHLTFTDGKTLERDFVLEPSAVELDSIAVVAKAPSPHGRMSEFEDRRARGFGHFVAQGELQKNPSRRLAEILAVIPGLSIRRAPGGQAWVTNGRGQISLT